MPVSTLLRRTLSFSLPAPQPVLSCDQAWPLYRAATSREIEAAAQARLPAHTLMARAGRSVARLAMAIAPHAPSAWIAAGPGNNGGDGLQAAVHLKAAGWAVQVHLWADPQHLPADAAWAFEQARQAGVPLVAGPALAAPTDLPAGCVAIDALLGLGSRRAPQGPIAQAVQALRQHRGPVLSVDLPTGLDADTGRCLGTGPDDAVRADHTLSLLTLKPGLFTAEGRDLAGRVWFDDLGVPPEGPADAWLGSRNWQRPARRHAQHKGSFGEVLAIGGAAGMTGALWLAAQAALAAGAGRVYVQPLDPQAPLLDPTHPELMGRRAETAAQLPTDTLTVVCGCGAGTAVAAILPWWIGRAPRLVLDADALNAVAADAGLQLQLQRRPARGQTTVLTPHPLEAARLLGVASAHEVQVDRLAAAQALAARLGCTVVLKGSGTVIAQASRAPWINRSGNAALATAGTGDVLAGWLAGLWAQGLDAWDAATLAAHEHGAAADRWVTQGHRGALRASALVEALQG
ncbi:MAG: NAD(P)H-hydrate dehydratase [Caldimonas sp.]